jgi:serine/threonine protein kinase
MQELWGDNPPGGGLKTLQYHVSKLRDTLQPDRDPGSGSVIVTRPNGYALQVSPDSVDVVRFERIVQDARRLIEFDPSQAAARLREGLDLWRGPLPTELLETGMTSLEARRLVELRLTAREDRINADLVTGHHAELVPELEALVAEYPLRERLWAQLMVALYRSDRQAEALRAYQRLRIVLGEELGIDPSPDLRRLEEEILLQKPDLDIPEGLRRPASLRGYELHEPIGEGAFGMVWRASQKSVERVVAMKVVRPEYSNRPGFVLGFQAEALRLAALEHPHIVPVFDFWRDPDGAYLVMQLMADGSLEDAEVDAWQIPQVIRVIEQVGMALAHAHGVGIVHGDLHPGNVLFDSEGNSYLTDFGLATFLSGGSSTPPESFASPEQLRGEPPQAASDVYSFGRLVYRILCGVNPGPGPLPRIGASRSDIPGAVDGVLRRATNLDPSQRYEGAGPFLNDFRAAFGNGRVAVAEARNPYKGLRSFDEADAPDFFGRDTQVEELLDAIASHRLVTVVGPSGCGKSSLVRAGLLPALRNGRFPGTDRLLHCEMYPGSEPFVALVEALQSVAVQSVPEASEPQWYSERIAALVESVLPPGARLVIVIDQFEELFTLCHDEIEQTRFMNALVDLSTDPESTTRLVMTLRADHYGLPLEHQPFGDVMRDGTIGLTPPGREQLLQAITGPATAVGLEIEPDLAANIVSDTIAEPGGLPLMEYALTRLVDDQDDGHLSLAAYRTMGGLTEALGSWPESLFAALGEEDQRTCQQVFLRLVSVDDGGNVVRHRVPLPELHGLAIAPTVVDHVLGRFAAARLLTFDNDPVTRVPTVEIAHEALLTRWGRLREWVDEYRESLIMHRRYRAAFTDWEQANRDSDYLLREGRLRQFESWHHRTDLVLTESEEEFLRASRDWEDAASSTRRRRRQLLTAALGLLAAVALVFGVFALVQRNRTAEQQHVAEEQAALALKEAARAETQADIAKGEQAKAAEERANAEAQERIARARGWRLRGAWMGQCCGKLRRLCTPRCRLIVSSPQRWSSSGPGLSRTTRTETGITLVGRHPVRSSRFRRVQSWMISSLTSASTCRSRISP